MTSSVRDRLRYTGTLPDPRDTPGVKSRAKAEKDLAATRHADDGLHSHSHSVASKRVAPLDSS